MLRFKMKKLILPLTISALALTACAKQTPEQTQPDEKLTESTAPVSNHAQSNQTVQNSPTNLTDTTHNTQNSLDWQGEYKGLLPCADCEGIETKLELNTDHTYELEEEYKGGKSTQTKLKVKGKFEFDPSGSIITLDQSAENRKFFVGENFIEARDHESGGKIEGPLAELYRLLKETN